MAESMFKMMLEMMGEKNDAVYQETGDPVAMWRKAWADRFLEAFEPDRKVVYTSLYAFPMELLAAFDVVPFDFEIASAMVCTTELGVPMMKEAEDRGYSTDICAFHRTSLGATFKALFPEPDLLTTISYYCNGKYKTNETIAAHHGKESLFLYVPAEISTSSVRYVKDQLREIAVRLAELTGTADYEERLTEAVRSSNRARKTQSRIHELLKHRPAPWGNRDLVGFSINSRLFNGTDVKERLNDALVETLEARIASGDLGPEKHRLLWLAWIPTYPSNLFQVLKEKAVTVPICETFLHDGPPLDEDDPFETLALQCLENRFVGPVTRRTDGLEGIVDDYGIDGALLFATPACRHANGAFRSLKDAVERSGAPFLMLDMDIGDPRGYSAEQTRTRLEGFVEVLDG